MRVKTLLQALLWPNPLLDPSLASYLRLSAGAHYTPDTAQIGFAKGDSLRTDTYFNIFNYGKWARVAPLQSLMLTLAGHGKFRLTLFAASGEAPAEALHTEEVSLTESTNVSLPVPLSKLAGRASALLFFELQCLSESGTLTAADWATHDAPRRTPKLALCITTYRREAQVHKTVQRFEAFASASLIGANLSLIVVDNGQSLTLPPSQYVTCVPNENLGGSGGFARGFLEAESAGATHCLFMDDDASVHMPAIARTWAFLAYAKDESVAVAGAVAQSQAPHKLWENGARFHMICRPELQGLDLRKAEEVQRLESATTPRNPSDFYGGWWYFAFSVSALKHMPFPFFVRGDDVSFSLAHDFDIVTLPGVLSYQDEDFPVKETPLTVYLDLRSHLAHHLALPAFEIGRIGIAKIIARFWLRSLLACHYETLAAAKLAVDDAFAGPELFARTADVAARRAEIAALTQTERWQPVDSLSAPKETAHASLPWRLLMKLTFNGHLLPAFSWLGKSITLPAEQRGARRPLWGARQITYISPETSRAYTVRHNKAKALALSLPFFAAMVVALTRYQAIKERWRTGYPAYTQRSFWQNRLAVETQKRDAHD